METTGCFLLVNCFAYQSVGAGAFEPLRLPWPVSPSPGPSANEAQMGMMSLLSWSGVPYRAHPQGCRIYALKQIMGHTQSSRGSLTGGAGSRPRAHFRLRLGPPFPSSCVSSYWQFLHPHPTSSRHLPPLSMPSLLPRLSLCCEAVAQSGMCLCACW